MRAPSFILLAAGLVLLGTTPPAMANSEQPRLMRAGIAPPDWSLAAHVLKKNPAADSMRFYKSDATRISRLLHRIDFRINMHLRNLRGLRAIAYKRETFEPDSPRASRLLKTPRTDFQMGAVLSTGRGLDMFIDHERDFFRLRLPGGGFAYQRSGRLFVDASGRLVNRKGYALSPPVTIPRRARTFHVMIEGDGLVKAVGDDAKNPVVPGRLKLFRFANPAGLAGNRDGLYLETKSSGRPGNQHGKQGRLLWGRVEASNVNFSRELMRLTALLNLHAAIVEIARQLEPAAVFVRTRPGAAGLMAWIDLLDKSLAAEHANVRGRKYLAFKKKIHWGIPIRAFGSPRNGSAGFRHITDYSQGSLKATGGKLDLGISGAGLFRMALKDGSFAYRRAGNFVIDRDGNIVSPNGPSIHPPLKVPADGRLASLRVQANGLVTIARMGQTTRVRIGQIKLYQFANPEGARRGYMFRETSASGPPLQGTPGLGGFGLVNQGYLEESNVNAVEANLKLNILRKERRAACEIAGRYYHFACVAEAAFSRKTLF